MHSAGGHLLFNTEVKSNEKEKEIKKVDVNGAVSVGGNLHPLSSKVGSRNQVEITPGTSFFKSGERGGKKEKDEKKEKDKPEIEISLSPVVSSLLELPPLVVPAQVLFTIEIKPIMIEEKEHDVKVLKMVALNFTKEYEIEDIRQKLEKIIEVTKNWEALKDGRINPHYTSNFYKQVSQLIGEGPEYFDNLDELYKFLSILNQDYEKFEFPSDIVEKLNIIEARDIKKALDKYLDWKVSKEEFNKKVQLETVLSKLTGSKSLHDPYKLLNWEIDLISLTNGYHIVINRIEMIGENIMDALDKDKKTSEQKLEVVLCLLRLILSLVNAAIAAELLKMILNGKNLDEYSYSNVFKFVLAEESERLVVEKGAEQVEKYIKEIQTKKISHTTILKMIRNLLKALKNDLNEAKCLTVKLSKIVEKNLESKALEMQVKRVLSKEQEKLKDRLRKNFSLQDFDYNDFVAEEIADNIRRETNAVIKQMEASVQKEALAIVYYHESAEIFNRLLILFLTGGTFCRNFHSIKSEEKSYREKDEDKIKVLKKVEKVQGRHIVSTIPGFKVMKKGDKFYHFPNAMDPATIRLCKPKPKKGKMKIDGNDLRNYVVSHVPELKNPVYGYDEKGNYKSKGRVKDTCRADQIIQIILIKQHDSSKPKNISILPLPTFKSAQELGEGILEIVEANLFFQTRNYKFEDGSLPSPSPLYLLTHLNDYKHLLEREGVKEFLRRHFEDPHSILECLTDPNLKNQADERQIQRMKRAFIDLCNLLHIIGLPENKYIEYVELGSEYINLQCEQTKLSSAVQLSVLRCCDHLSIEHNIYHEQIRERLLDPLLDDIIQRREHLKKSNPNDHHIRLIEEIILGYLHPDYDKDLSSELHMLLPQLLHGNVPENKDLQTRLDEHRAKMNETIDVTSFDDAFEVMKDIQKVKNEFLKFKEYQTKAVSKKVGKKHHQDEKGHKDEREFHKQVHQAQEHKHEKEHQVKKVGGASLSTTVSVFKSQSVLQLQHVVQSRVIGSNPLPLRMQQSADFNEQCHNATLMFSPHGR